MPSFPTTHDDKFENGSIQLVVFKNKIAPSDGIFSVDGCLPSYEHATISMTSDPNGVITDTAPSTAAPLCCIYRGIRSSRRWYRQKRGLLMTIVKVIAFLGYLAFFAYCMYLKFGDEPSIRLLVGTILGLLIVTHHVLKRRGKVVCAKNACKVLDVDPKRKEHFRRIVKWGLYILTTVGAVIYIIVDIAMDHPQNLISLGGLIVFILLSFVISTEPEKINWHAVYWGMALQFWFAVFIRRTSFGGAIFVWLGDRIIEFLKYTDKGSEVVFNSKYLDHRFVFQLMPTIIFFNAVISMLYYLGIVQVFIAEFGRFLSFCIGTSPIESVNAAANIFLSMTEAPMLIQPFLGEITLSELFAVMTGGFASIAGALFWAFASYGAPADHLLTASAMSAPAALAFAKLMFPDERKPSIKAEDAYKVDLGKYGSLLGAFSKGASEGLSMAGFIVVNLLIYVAILEFLDMTLLWFTERAGLQGFTFTRLVAYIFYPMAYVMGFEIRDCFKMARLLGVKILTTTQVSYIELGRLIHNNEALVQYMGTTNGTWREVGDDVFLEATNMTLVGGTISERSVVLATYMLCGLSNLGSIGITIGFLSSLAPTRAKDIIKYVPFALLAGNFASFSTACVAGLLYTG